MWSWLPPQTAPPCLPWVHTHDEQRREVLQPEPGWVEALQLQPDHQKTSWDALQRASWRLILLFYLVFHGFLAALFVFTMWAMLQSLNDEVPKYRDQISSPGLNRFSKISVDIGIFIQYAWSRVSIPVKGTLKTLISFESMCIRKTEESHSLSWWSSLLNRSVQFLLHVSFLWPYIRCAVVWMIRLWPLQWTPLYSCEN